MPFFEYTAADKEGKIELGQIEAIDREGVISYLKEQNLLVISAKEKDQQVFKKVLLGKISTVEKIEFAANLSVMLKAGVSMPEAIEVISSDSKNPRFKQILSDVRFGLENGKSLSDGLNNYPRDFNEVFVNLVRAGEVSGKISEVLEKLGIQLKKDYSLVSKVKGAFAYPAVLISGLVGLVVLLMTFVLPKLVTIFQTSNLKLPLPTKIIFYISQLFAYNVYLTIAVFLLVVIGSAYFLQMRKVKNRINQLMLRIPVANNLVKQIELARFSRTLANLLHSGIPIAESLELSASSMTVPIYQKMVRLAKEDIVKGVSITNAFQQEAVFPEMLISVLRVGEKTGELDTLLVSLADFYEEQADNTLKTLTNLIEPILLVIVGLAIGGIALSIILPVYQLIGNI